MDNFYRNPLRASIWERVLYEKVGRWSTCAQLLLPGAPQWAGRRVRSATG